MVTKGMGTGTDADTGTGTDEGSGTATETYTGARVKTDRRAVVDASHPVHEARRAAYKAMHMRRDAKARADQVKLDYAAAATKGPDADADGKPRDIASHLKLTWVLLRMVFLYGLNIYT